MEFSGKVFIITGAGSGIGAGVALHLAKLGADVSIVDINDKHLNETSEKMIKAGSAKPLSITADITKNAERIINETVNHFGRLDVLVNNAGILIKDSVTDFDPANFDRILDVNLKSVIMLTHFAIPHLEQTKGNVVNISSVGSLRPNDLFLSYCISKAAVDQFTKCAAMRLASKGIRVNAVAPGVIQTPIFQSVGIGQQDVEHSESSLVDRIGQPSDIGSAIAFLAKESFINGIVMLVDGGYIASGNFLEF